MAGYATPRCRSGDVSVVHLRAGGTSLVLDARGDAVPVFVHWGADLGELRDDQLTALADAQVPAIAHASPDIPLTSSVFPMLIAGWQGHPALSGNRAGSRISEPIKLKDVRLESLASVRLEFGTGEHSVELHYELTEEGLLRAIATLTNVGSGDYELAELNLVLPLPDRAGEILDFTGHWSGERRPQRRPLRDGAVSREIRHGRPGHDSPFVFAAGTPSFGFASGEVWALHLGWSGNQRVWAERQPSGLSVVGAGELLESGEIVLAEGERYSTPPVYAGWSKTGLDGISARFHRYLRRTRGFDRRAHPVILNTWEAVYFDHDETKLRALADLAASVGVERFVLDDGWMSGRVDDKRGLGDWTVDIARRPTGLKPLIDYVRSLGMDFGLWVEPEMRNLDSETAREHPDWVLSDTAGSTPVSARHQFVVDLALPAAFDHVLGQLSALLETHPISYLKWDHNRDLLNTSAHAQTLAVYRLMDELSMRHPSVEIESCASGGGRIDFGILERTTRVWPSDTNDSLERQAIYRWTTLLIPPEVFGAHLGAATAHTTGRTHSLSFRLATALFGWAGIEWNLADATPDELRAITIWVSAYKDLRPILHSGRMVRADGAGSLWVHGVVAEDRADAVFAVVSMGLGDAAIPPAVRFPGLDPAREYAVMIVDLGAKPRYFATRRPPWMIAGPIRLSGRLLADVGIAAPPLAPEQAIVLRVTAQ